MLAAESTMQFRRDLRLAKKRGLDLEDLKKIMNLIQQQKPLPVKLRDHPLTGIWNHHRECHVNPDWLLIYRLIEKEKVVIFVRNGTHSDLFD